VVEYQLDGYSFWEGELVCSSHAYHVIIINYILNLNPTRGLGLRRPPPLPPPSGRAGRALSKPGCPASNANFFACTPLAAGERRSEDCYQF
jgi:hypothetical protein